MVIKIIDSSLGQLTNQADGIPFFRRMESVNLWRPLHGPEGVRFYTRLKTITSRWPTGVRAGAEFVMPAMS
jgi:hypothetical protein